MAKNKFSDERLKAIQTQMDSESKRYDYFIKDYPFEVIDSKYGEDEKDERTTLYVPAYQRKFVWDNKKKSRFIESVFLGISLMPFLVSESSDKKLEIIDGSQRIRTLITFYNGGFKLKGLKKLTKLDGSKFSDLPNTMQQYFKNSDFRIIILNEVNDEIKQDIFSRINTSSEKLTDSEIRKGSLSGPFYDMVLELKDDVNFIEVCPMSSLKDERGEYEELILRFFAYKDKYKLSKSQVAEFLNQYLDDMNKKDFDLCEYINSFRKMVDFVCKYFPCGFQKDTRNKSIPRVRFEAIAVGVHLALLEKPSLTNPDITWIESKGFKKQTTTDASNSTNRLKNRIEFVRDGLLGKLSEDRLSDE
jgi:uncharacterized protein with ParB-like and HNH nuclease domain